MAHPQAPAYLHPDGVIHWDLKPGDVLIGPDDRLIIADFGTAQPAGARRLTFQHLTSLPDTSEYMSPEPVQGSRGDARREILRRGRDDVRDAHRPYSLYG